MAAPSGSSPSPSAAASAHPPAPPSAAIAPKIPPPPRGAPPRGPAPWDYFTPADLPAAIVVDWGRGFVKAGLGAEQPAVRIPAVAGRFRSTRPGANFGSMRRIAGEAVYRARSEYDVVRPFDRSAARFILNADLADTLMQHTFSELRVGAEECMHVHGVCATAKIADFEDLARISFESFSAPVLHLVRDASLAVLGSGRLTGLAVSIGDQVICAAPVCDGHTLTHAAVCVPLAGADITQFLRLLMLPHNDERHLTLDEPSPVRLLKEAHAYVADDFAAELAQATEGATGTLTHGAQRYTLPPTALFRCAEILFQPHLADTGVNVSLPQAILESISKCDPDLQHVMRDNVILHGGTALMRGLAHRLLKELRTLSGHDRWRLIRPPGDLAYHGGALLASMTDELQRLWIRREDWDEEGPRCVRRCVY